VLEQKRVDYFIRLSLSFRDLRLWKERIIKMGVNVRILCVCVVLFMAIEAMGVHKTAPMDQFSGTFLLCHCYFIFWFA